ncbi:MAG: response regulator [Bacteroidetes bacterium]|nr:response regulator [Bacteroidota bacterium]
MDGNPGADFWFTIQVKRGQYAAKVSTVNRNNDGVFENKLNILVAEDNVINQLLIRKVLESMNCEVTLVENGKLAVEALKEKSFDALLLDIQMPVMDGHQAAMVIRQSGNISIPIIGVSANVFKEDIEKSLMSGMDAHLGKPFTAKELFKVLKDKINSTRATTKLNFTRIVQPF